MRRHIHKECPDLPTDRQRFSSDEFNGQPYTVMNLFIKNLHYQKLKRNAAVVNTRNPFDRLHASWSDKFRWNSSFQRHENALQKTKFFYDTVELLDQPKYEKSSQMLSSFQAFIQYILLSDGYTLNNHWRTFFWSCRPCEQRYDYIVRIENSFNESN